MRSHLQRACAVGIIVMSFAFGAPSAIAEPTSRPIDCPTVLPTTEAVAGLIGTGYTVERGNLVEPFTAEVLGRIRNGIGPGMDMIMADLSSPALSRAGGVWAGMSGSPVYTADGRLIGAVAYGLASNSSIAGLTPAEDLIAVLGEPTTSGMPASPDPLPDVVRVPGAVRGTLARTGASSVSRFRRLPLPVMITGASQPTAQRYLGELNARMPGTRLVAVEDQVVRKADTDWMPAAPAIFAGSNLAAGLAYGDLDAVATGTTTLVCGDRVVAFGHPFEGTGAAGYSMHSADAVYVQPDPLSGPFKVANTGPVVGTIDRDLIPGIGGVLGVIPSTVAVTSSFTIAGGQPVTGRTDVVVRAVLADVAAIHTLLNVERVLRYSGPGSSSVTITVTGIRADGSPFEVAWSGSTSSETIDEATADAVYATLRAFEDQPYERVSITGVDITGTLDSAQRSAYVASLTVDQGGQFVEVADEISVDPGGVLAVRAELLHSGGTDPAGTLDVELAVPTDFSGGFLQVSAGLSHSPGVAVFAGSFDQFLAALAAAPGPDQLVVRLTPRLPDPIPPPDELPEPEVGQATAGVAIEPFTASATVVVPTA